MIICSRCGGNIPDLGGHNCFVPKPNVNFPMPYIPSPNPPIKGQKCDMCGSTAIDHTETQCQLNQRIKRNNH